MGNNLRERLAALVAEWREQEQKLCRQADGQGKALYADLLAAKADGMGTCADQLDRLLAALDPPAPQEPLVNG